MEQKSIRVRIYGSEYPLKVDDEQLTYRSAQQIDRMMSELHTHIPDQPPVTLAVLTALNMAENLHHEQVRGSQLLKQTEQELRSISQLFDEAMGV
jgi:cell division protein ZapA